MSWLYSLIFAGLLFSSDAASTGGNNFAVNANRSPETMEVSDVTEKFEQSYPLNADGRVSVSNVNGSISIEAWERNEVRLEAVKIADSPESLATIRLDIQSSPTRFKVEAELDRHDGRESRKMGKREVQFKLSVPRTALLDEIETVNGSVSVRDFVRVVRISAVNGTIVAENIGGTVEISTVNGEVRAEFDRVDSGSRIDLGTVNGRIDATFPSDVDAIVKADSLNGEIKNDFGLPVRKGQFIGRNLSGRIGGGSARIKLSSVNGGLSLGRKNDGKIVKPAVDLLENDAEGAIFSAPERIPEIARVEMRESIKRAVKETEAGAVALDAARQTLEVLQPELEKITSESFDRVKAELASEEFKAKLRTAVAAQAEVIARMKDVNWPVPPSIIKERNNTLPASPGSDISVETKGCDIRVIGWDKPEVRYIVTEETSVTKAKPMELSENRTESSINLKFINDSTESPIAGALTRLNNARIDVYVPSKSNLILISDGTIRVSRINGKVELKGRNEPVNVRDLEGRLVISVDDSVVRIVGFKGELETASESGDIFLEGEFSGVKSSSKEGNIILTTPDNSNFTVSSNTGIDAGSIPVIRSEVNTFLVGNGGPLFRFDLGSGQLSLRRPSVANIY